MTAFAFFVHHERPLAAELATDAIGWLRERGHEVRLPPEDAAVVGAEELAVDPEELPHGLDVAVSVGGDGTMLRCVAAMAPHDIPVIGVNVGQLGYLTAVEPSGMRMAIKRFLAGSYFIEDRMMLAVTVTSAETAPRTLHGLNEAVLEKTEAGHTVRIEVVIDGDPFTPYAADGLIVATPTGSTAYSFSARGPIVSPRHRALILTPVSPHMLFDRSLVLDPHTRLRLEVAGHRPAALTVDGRLVGVLPPGAAAECTASTHSARLVGYGPRHFHRILKAKFGLADR